MKASERGADPGRNRWLLIGNSRWHWAMATPDGLQCWSGPPQTGEPQPGEPLPGEGPVAWAAVGPLPARSGLDPARRLTLAHIPLASAPPWLGVDRALVAWEAWQDCRLPVLVADAGTALSLTRVDGAGRFAGGRILAGAALQWRALASETAQLPRLHAQAGDAGSAGTDWPSDTVTAMRVGVLAGLAAAVQAAWQDACREFPSCQLRITGGDGAVLAARLGLSPDPDLALRALVRLRPGPGP
ncbi:type III pantothenate kinase [Cyanobium sp. NIES-981]|uniref:type III pantothenate kinase n=1 Tax=Cyanobium sp. NIES-981 TaxID=1851505 RepID=UPI0007DD1958|nr:type III pantothenate kinase [Cyanobium sp. NIES-981]SBO44758.1 Type III pantothenate kinase [Cyanobium sp. NIES-981]